MYMSKKSIHYIQMPHGVDSDGMRVIEVYDHRSNRPRIPVGRSSHPEPDETSTIAKAVRDLMVYSKAHDLIDTKTVEKAYSMIEDGILQGSFRRGETSDLIAEVEKFDAWVTAERAEVEAKAAKVLAEAESAVQETDVPPESEPIPEASVGSGSVEVLAHTAPNHS